jgi:hypothetical protein
MANVCDLPPYATRMHCALPPPGKTAGGTSKGDLSLEDRGRLAWTWPVNLASARRLAPRLRSIKFDVVRGGKALDRKMISV